MRMWRRHKALVAAMAWLLLGTAMPGALALADEGSDFAGYLQLLAAQSSSRTPTLPGDAIRASFRARAGR